MIDFLLMGQHQIAVFSEILRIILSISITELDEMLQVFHPKVSLHELPQHVV